MYEHTISIRHGLTPWVHFLTGVMISFRHQIQLYDHNLKDSSSEKEDAPSIPAVIARSFPH